MQLETAPLPEAPSNRPSLFCFVFVHLSLAVLCSAAGVGIFATRHSNPSRISHCLHGYLLPKVVLPAISSAPGTSMPTSIACLIARLSATRDRVLAISTLTFP